MESVQSRERALVRKQDRMLTALFIIVIAGIAFNVYAFYTTQGKVNALAVEVLSLQNGTGHSSSFSAQFTQFGSRLTNIDQPLNSSELAVINNAPQSYFETAGAMLLNGSISDLVQVPTANSTYKTQQFTYGGKPSVIYIGAISCIYCGENRWAMALALGQFGSFTKLYKGYSSFGDEDVPTLYWTNDNYTTPSGVGYGNGYHSNYINFFSADYESPIVEGFQVQPLSYFVSLAPNSTYLAAMSFMNSTNKFEGTPFTLWGNVLSPGADGVVFGNTTPSGTTLPLTYMTHEQVLSQFKNFNDRFAWGEYAAADVYIAYLCPAINNTASICSLPAIKQLEADAGAA
ncbi:DUF929 family protein [Candidatus Marsarchaeota archaeon]|jgi:hypothetical protein|nr:DUF929 family protein [Candidatus Marsarchaeota archaeon]MCL5100070.1 DUF929 family protein [Candidatus Marsarchaeota archaeon]